MLESLGPGEGAHLLETGGNLCHWGLVTGDQGKGRAAHLANCTVAELLRAAVARVATRLL